MLIKRKLELHNLKLRLLLPSQMIPRPGTAKQLNLALAPIKQTLVFYQLCRVRDPSPILTSCALNLNKKNRLNCKKSSSYFKSKKLGNYPKTQTPRIIMRPTSQSYRMYSSRPAFWNTVNKNWPRLTADRLLDSLFLIPERLSANKTINSAALPVHSNSTIKDHVGMNSVILKIIEMILPT